jgi:hypothetical protein
MEEEPERRKLIEAAKDKILKELLDDDIAYCIQNDYVGYNLIEACVLQGLRDKKPKVITPGESIPAKKKTTRKKKVKKDE